MNEIELQRIEAYLNGSMTAGERREFEAKLAVNEELAATLQVYRTIETEMHHLQKDKDAEAALRQTLGDAGSRHFSEQSTSASKDVSDRMSKVIKLPFRAVLAAAAAILIIIALSSIIYFNTRDNHNTVITGTGLIDTAKRQKDSGVPVKSSEQPADKELSVRDNSFPTHKVQDQLFASNFHLDAVPDDMGDLSNGLSLYGDGNYKGAVTSLEIAQQVTAKGETDKKLNKINLYYYLALSYMSLGRMDKAIPKLETVLKLKPDKSFQSKTQWYLALAHLKKGELEKCEKLLNQLVGSEQSSKYKNRAIKLLAEIAKYR